MEKNKEEFSKVDIISYQSGVNLGYSLATLTDNPEILETINSEKFRNKEHEFFRGLCNGFDKAILDRDLGRNSKRNQRLSELSNARNRDQDKELER